MGGRWCDPELHRRNGDLHATAGDDAAAEAAYRQAVDLARYQGARALELRSATRLAVSWGRRGRDAEIGPLLLPIVEALDGTTDLPDLDLARSILRSGSG